MYISKLKGMTVDAKLWIPIHEVESSALEKSLRRVLRFTGNRRIYAAGRLAPA